MREGTIKSSLCADGSSQREYMAKSDKNLPSESLEAMMMACAINAKKNRHVSVTDIPGSSYMLK